MKFGKDRNHLWNLLKRVLRGIRFYIKNIENFTHYTAQRCAWRGGGRYRHCKFKWEGMFLYLSLKSLPEVKLQTYGKIENPPVFTAHWVKHDLKRKFTAEMIDLEVAGSIILNIQPRFGLLKFKNHYTSYNFDNFSTNSK